MPDADSFPSHERAPAANIAAALVASFAAALGASLTPFGFVGRYNDDSLYATSAWSLAHHLGYTYPFGPVLQVASRFPPLFPLVLAPTWLLTGSGPTGPASPRLSVTAMQIECLAFFFAFAVVVYLALRIVGGLPAWQAVAGEALIALHPLALRYAGAVMSDVLAALLGWIGLIALARAERTPGGSNSSGWWAVTCAALGMAILARYAALALLVAEVGALVWHRRWRPALLLAATAGGSTAGWLAFSIHHGAIDYATQISGWSAAALAPTASLALGAGVSSFVLPAFLRGYPLDPPGGWAMTVGAGVTLVCLYGLWEGWRRASAAALALRLYAGIVVILTIVWSAGFAGMGADLVGRLLLPAAPAYVWGFVRAFRRTVPGGRRLLVWAIWMLAALASWPAAVAPVMSEARQFEAFLPEHWALMAAIDRMVPAGRVVATVRPATLWLYAHRPAVATPLGAADLGPALERIRVRYVVGEPLIEGNVDVVRLAFDRSFAHDPTWARMIYVTPGQHLALFAVRGAGPGQGTLRSGPPAL